MKNILKFLIIILIILFSLSYCSTIMFQLSSVDTTSFSKKALEITGWDWYTRTTTDDIAYNGEHVKILDDDIYFYGYGVISYKDFLFKNCSISYDKLITFRIDELVTDWHTLEGGGFLLNSSIENKKLSGYCLLYEKETISLYEINSIDIDAFGTTPSSTISKTYGTQLVSVSKDSTTNTHDLVLDIKADTVTVSDNNKEIINYTFDTPATVGGYGPIVSYTQHNCPSLSKIEFENLNMKEITKVQINNICDDNNEAISGTTINIYDSTGSLIDTKKTDNNGNIVLSLPAGKYTFSEKDVNNKYVLNSNTYEFSISNDGTLNGTFIVKNKLVVENTSPESTSPESTIVVSDTNTSTSSNSFKDTSKSTNKLPYAGLKNVISILLVGAVISSIIFKIKGEHTL